MKLFIALFLVLFAALQYQLWFARGGIIDITHLNKTIAAQEAINQKQRKQNAILEAEVKELKSGQSAIEDRARSQLGMVKRDEDFYQIVN